MRKAVFSGSFYPDNPAKLNQQLTSFFTRFVQQIPLTSKPYALLVPHAGYLFSGQVTSAAFSQIRSFSYKHIVILGPSHRFAFNGISIDKESIFQTPLGNLTIDQDLCSKLRSEADYIDFWEDAHNNEHSIEVECPFIYHLYQDSTPIIPVVIGNVDLSTLNAFAHSLTTYFNRSDTLIIVSTDFSHFYDASTAEEMDHKAIDLIHRFAFERLWEYQQYGKIEMCGIAPTMVLAALLKAYDIKTSMSLMYRHSGMVSGDTESVVGYHSALFG